MTRLFMLAALAAVSSQHALADDDALRAYLHKASCSSLEPGAIVADVGDLDQDQHASKE